MKSNYETLVSLSECRPPPWSSRGHLPFRTTPGSAWLWALGRPVAGGEVGVSRSQLQRLLERSQCCAFLLCGHVFID